jgi:hypothetical protein
VKHSIAATIALAFFGIVLLSQVNASTAQVRTAQQDDPNKTQFDYMVYLPFVAKPPCSYVHPTAYVAVSKPVVRVGEIVTATGALVNICAHVGHPFYSMGTQQTDILSPSHIFAEGVPPTVLYNSFQEVTLTMQATAAGVATITLGASWETEIPGHQDYAISGPAVIYVLP